MITMGNELSKLVQSLNNRKGTQILAGMFMGIAEHILKAGVSASILQEVIRKIQSQKINGNLHE